MKSKGSEEVIVAWVLMNDVIVGSELDDFVQTDHVVIGLPGFSLLRLKPGRVLFEL
ncbi:hypothetical protein JCM39194_20120 [Desulfotomaculum varum]